VLVFQKPLSFLAKAGTLEYLKMWQVHQHQPHHADAGLSPQFQCNDLSPNFELQHWENIAQRQPCLTEEINGAVL
jgi:hypothetical protein